MAKHRHIGGPISHLNYAQRKPLIQKVQEARAKFWIFARRVFVGFAPDVMIQPAGVVLKAAKALETLIGHCVKNAERSRLLNCLGCVHQPLICEIPPSRMFYCGIGDRGDAKKRVMQELHNPFVTSQFLNSVWALDYAAYKDSVAEREVDDRLRRWAGRADLRERAAQAAFIEEFFRQTWGYAQAGQAGAEAAFSIHPDFAVRDPAAGGRQRFADAALGNFLPNDQNHIPQVLCEFKDIRSGLDAPQRRKNDNRSPVEQGLSYLAAARSGIFGTEPIIPTWAIITDMNEFRLYWADRGSRQSLRFVINPRDLFQGPSLLAQTEEARFERYLFQRLFHRDTLTVRGASGRPDLLRLIEQQRFRQRALENAFYAEYRAFREHLYQALLVNNGEETDRFPGTRGRLVRLAQKILDRCIFVFFCEDMGAALRFPPQLLRNFLIDRSTDPYLHPDGFEIWDTLLRLFGAMNDGSAFGDKRINQFNGGLFASDQALERLRIPNSVFCERGQGQNDESLAANRRTLLYLSAFYNYAAGWSEGVAPAALGADRPASKSLGLYTLGRIFEQSITELEILEADADERTSLNRVNKRKRDGVYYTPEWVVERIVAETVGGRLADLKAQCGWPAPGGQELPSEETVYAYDAALREVRIVDPACGSGAFLIAALRYLIEEWTALRAIRRDVFGEKMVRDDDGVIRDILRRNIYGVDINPASVELAKLALWLHTARGDQPLSGLDDHVREGNSLIGPEFYDGLAPYTPEERERINAFDWRATFPEVFECGGFDAVIGNPPYVKLQNFRRVHQDMARFLARPLAEGGRYASTQTGNFDLYLAFIEKGITLLNERGRLGYIAPSLWPAGDYGGGLRGTIEAGRNLYGWIDFGSYQIFDEATTYTALQFFTRRPNDIVRVAQAHDGTIPEEPWRSDDCVLPYERIAFGNRWLLATGPERDLIDRLAGTCLRLEDRRLTTGIFVGLQTSADYVYHLVRRAPNRYLCTPPGRGAEPYEVRIEDEIMKPLASGADAKRYVVPETETFILFPYRVGASGAQLIPAADMENEFPQAWTHLLSWEAELRARENGAFNDGEWWRFGRSQNLDKQEIEKLIVPRLVVSVSCSADPGGAVYLDNVDVGGIAPAAGIPLFYLAGILNAPVASFVFRRISKPFRGDYRSANRQFIAPLPIPDAPADDQRVIASRAERLQALHTRRRELLADIGRRMSVVRVRPQREDWLFPNLPSIRDLEEGAPDHIDRAERSALARERRKDELNGTLELLGEDLRPGVSMDASFADRELRFFIDGSPVIERIFLGEEEGAFVLAQWKLIASDFSITERTSGKKLADALRKVALTAAEPVRQQIIDLQRELSDAEAEIAAAEGEMNAHVYRLYGLARAEITLVEAG